MNIINILTQKHLKENRSRTIVTILGIVISVAMITAVFATTASFFDFFAKLAVISDGKGVATFRQIPYSVIMRLKEDDRIAVVGIKSEDETASGYTLAEGTTMFTKRGSMYTGDITHLITLIAITNIVNTVSTGITQRRKEFAMLKSVGMTPKGFNRMIRLESMLFAISKLKGDTIVEVLKEEMN